MVWIQEKIGEFQKKNRCEFKKNCSEVVLDTKMFKNNMAKKKQNWLCQVSGKIDLGVVV